MKEGVIIEVSKNKLKVITPEGEFLEIKNNHEFNQIGDLIYFEPHISNGIPRTLSTRKKTAIKTIIALAASILLVFSILPLTLENSKVYAYVSLDMDSSVELSVSEEMKVLDIQGIDQEGKEMLTDLKEWENQDLDIVVTKLLSLLHKEGKIQYEKEVVFSTVVLDQDKSLEKNLEKKLTNVQAIEVSSVKIETQKATIDDRQNAKEKGLSTGAYLDAQTEEDTAKNENRNQSSSKIGDENKDNLIKEELDVPIKEQSSTIKKEKKPSIPSKPAQSKEQSEKEKNPTASSPSKNQKKNSSNENKLNKKDGLKPPISDMRKNNSNVTDKKHREQTKKPSNQGKDTKRESGTNHTIKRNDDKSKNRHKEHKDNRNRQMDSRNKNEQKKEKRNISEQKHKGQQDNYDHRPK